MKLILYFYILVFLSWHNNPIKDSLIHTTRKDPMLLRSPQSTPFPEQEAYSVEFFFHVEIYLRVNLNGVILSGPLSGNTNIIFDI
jgi:hypothetical protein